MSSLQNLLMVFSDNNDQREFLGTFTRLDVVCHIINKQNLDGKKCYVYEFGMVSAWEDPESLNMLFSSLQDTSESDARVT